MVVRDIERDEIEFISKTLGCMPVAHIEQLKPEKLGSAELVEEIDVSLGARVPCWGCLGRALAWGYAAGGALPEVVWQVCLAGGALGAWVVVPWVPCWGLPFWGGGGACWGALAGVPCWGVGGRSWGCLGRAGGVSCVGLWEGREGPTGLPSTCGEGVRGSAVHAACRQGTSTGHTCKHAVPGSAALGLY
jgi:hypothetical protein